VVKKQGSGAFWRSEDLDWAAVAHKNAK